MPTIKEARRLFLIVAVLLGAISLASIGVLLSPIGKVSRTGPRQLAQLWAELRTKEAEVGPLRGIDQKVVTAKEQVGSFYQDRLPHSYASISEELGKVAAESGLRMTTGRYAAEATEIPGVQRISIDAGITGDYLQAVKFLNAMEREKMFFLVNSVSLGQQQAGSVQLQIQMETYLKVPERKSASM